MIDLKQIEQCSPWSKERTFPHWLVLFGHTQSRRCWSKTILRGEQCSTKKPKPCRHNTMFALGPACWQMSLTCFTCLCVCHKHMGWEKAGSLSKTVVEHAMVACVMPAPLHRCDHLKHHFSSKFGRARVDKTLHAACLRTHVSTSHDFHEQGTVCKRNDEKHDVENT